MVGELVFTEEQDKVALLARIVAALHWAAPLVARSCRTSLENIGFFGPRKVLRKGRTLLIYRLARVYGTDRAALRESVWARKAVFLDPESVDGKERHRRNGKKVAWQSPASAHASPLYGGAVWLG